MHYFILTVFFTTALYLCFRFFSVFKVHTFQAVAVNYWVCVLTGLLTFKEAKQIFTLDFSLFWVQFTILLGGLFILTFYLLAVATQVFGVGVASVANKISLVIPVLFSLLIFQSSLKTFDFLNYTGFFFAFAAIILCSWKADKTENSQISTKHIYLPLLVFVFSGAIDTSINFINLRYIQSSESAIFSVLCFASAGFFGLLVLIFQYFQTGKFLTFQSILGGICLGIPNFFSLYFLVLSLSAFNNDGAFLFPIFNISVILSSTFFAFILFRERLSFANQIGILLAITAIFLLAYQEILT